MPRFISGCGEEIVEFAVEVIGGVVISCLKNVALATGVVGVVVDVTGVGGIVLSTGIARVAGGGVVSCGVEDDEISGAMVGSTAEGADDEVLPDSESGVTGVTTE